PPAEAWRSTGRSPLTRRIEADRRRVSPSYRPSPRLSGWTSPNGSESRYRLPCLRTWTEPRSVALTIGRTTGSKNRVASAPAARDLGRGAAAAVPGAGFAASAAVRPVVARPPVRVGQVAQAVGLVGHHEGVDQRVELALEDARHVVDRDPDPMVGDPVVGEVVGP